MEKKPIRFDDQKKPPLVTIVGPINEQTSKELLPLIDQIKESCQFNLKEVTSVNSLGTMAWVRFMGLLGQKCPHIELHECSVDFIAQANMIASFFGSGRVLSFYGLYCCTDCPHEESHLFDLASLKTHAGEMEKRIHMPLICGKCGNEMELSDDAKTYLQKQLKQLEIQRKTA